MSLHFAVDGTPVTQGSMRAMTSRTTGKMIVLHGKSKGLTAWRNSIAGAARDTLGPLHGDGPRWPKDTAIVLRIHFRLPRPKSYPKRVVWPVYKGDVDKLARAVFDACTGILYADDGQVVRATITKRYIQPGEQPGVDISARAVGSNAAAERKAA